MPNIRDLPNELLLWIISHLDDNNVDLTAALLQHNTNINAFYRGKIPLIRAFQYSSTAIHKLLLNRRELDINI
ncbi:Ankyrin repeat-containing domain [Penicillium roqueforti FM164]|uniref:Ankyrin repeat-containing domain n=1 Tax=Penicillium roqueforti (strain FM164) TaxID=1365484 RepID=W6QWN9_PENRF|nr:Ankyrin repeat-containing domain [Penicillium roqueforti FM164]